MAGRQTGNEKYFGPDIIDLQFLQVRIAFNKPTVYGVLFCSTVAASHEYRDKIDIMTVQPVGVKKHTDDDEQKSGLVS